ncbi:MAG: pyruvate ferredoxin oxidoreductase [Candidatus Aenigmarchaeota archaeon]|nr:pyruvate ferredoxin oxidoreductase [Candidatus Aenigmarchaeota archaeon]
MQVTKVIEGSHAIAEAVKIAGPKVIAAYPITPQTHIIEMLADMVAAGAIDAEYINVESEHSALAACIGAQATGVRTFTATSSQGLALMFELLHVASGMRLPLVMAVGNRALSAPLNIWNDWSDSVSCRDSGWIQLYCESPQEAYDTVIQAYRIAEHKRVLLPVMVCVDGYYLTHTSEPVSMLTSLDGFLGDYEPEFKLDTENPLSLGEYANPDYYQEFKEAQHNAMGNALSVIGEVNEGFARKFGRGYGNGVIETFNMENASHAVLTMGTLSSTIKYFIEREKSDVGLIRLRSFRPFPSEDLKKVCSDVRSIAVIEKDISFGSGGAVATELRSVMDIPVASFVGGLGGRDITLKQIKEILGSTGKSGEGLTFVGSRL